MISDADTRLFTPDELKQRLLQIGYERYHHRHPFHLLMHEGKLTRGQLQAWALNRYYYQSQIPVKEAIILSRSNDPAFRRAWRKRILDHDGIDGQAGGIEKWIKLAEATGLPAERVKSEREVLPGVRYAVDAYLNLVSRKTQLEAVASSLTELFSRDLISLASMLCAAIIRGSVRSRLLYCPFEPGARRCRVCTGLGNQGGTKS